MNLNSIFLKILANELWCCQGEKFKLTNYYINTMSTRGWGTLLSKPYEYVLLQTVLFLCLFSLKMGIHLAHFGLESSTDLRDLQGCMNIFVVSIPTE